MINEQAIGDQSSERRLKQDILELSVIRRQIIEEISTLKSVYEEN